MNRKIQDERIAHPQSAANRISKMTFWYLRHLFKTGIKRPITEEDVYQTLDDHKYNVIIDRFTLLWDEELKKKNPSVLRLFYNAYGFWTVGIGLCFSIIETANRCAQPLLLGALLTYFVDNTEGVSKGMAYAYASGIVLCSLVPVLTFHPFILYIFEIGMKLRIGSAGLIYKKILNLSKSAVADGLSGRVVNILTNDLNKFELALAFLHDLWKGPLETILLGYLVYREIGISGIVGILFILSFIPIQSWIGKKSAEFRSRTTKVTDIRVRFMNEIIQGIQLIKMYTWEGSFAKMIAKTRKKEMKSIRGSAYILALLLSMWAVSRVSIFLTLVSYVYSGSVISARKVFIVTAFYNILNESMVHFWPLALTFCAEGYISVNRLRDFLMMSESKPQAIMNKNGNGNNLKELKIDALNGLKTDEVISVLHPKRILEVDSTTKGQIIMDNATAAWISEAGLSNTGVESINLNLKPGSLCAVIGCVGSGKTSLLGAILGELELDSGLIEIHGKLSYAAQEPWLFEGSLRSNIIFIEDFDESRYSEVIKACGLERDLELFEFGDKTIVGERGISLSGGQKARVNLARAVYKKADIYLLDDPLSAVDTEVGKHIFQECVEKYLSNKTVILVTHQLQYLNKLENVILVNGGKIEARGSYNEIKESKIDTLLSILPDEAKDVPLEQAKVNIKKRLITETSHHEIEDKDTPVEEKEAQKVGSVDFKVYKGYLSAIESIPLVIAVIVLRVLAQIAASGIDFFVATWVNWEESLSTVQPQLLNSTVQSYQVNSTESPIFNNTSTDLAADPIFEERQKYILAYTILMVTLVVVILKAEFSFFYALMRASKNLHFKMFNGITNTYMSFFNKNPSGRVLNRFSNDIGNIDTRLPNTMFDCTVFILEILAVMILVSIVNPFFIIPTVIMAIILYMFRYVYVQTSRSMKRTESILRSPIFSHTNATLQGLSTIRALGAEKSLVEDFSKYYDQSTSASYMFVLITRAFAFWLDLVCVVYIGIITYTFVEMDNSDIPGGNVGLAITQVIGLIGMCQWGMRQTAELENQMVSVERVLEYSQLPSEETNVEKQEPPKDWPKHGSIVFKDVELRYFEDIEPSLRNLSFSIAACEKIGIVGRTGAGKSSIIQALFRLAPITGSIEIDEVSTNDLQLQHLRSKISIIPQDPILFSGTLRSNLDPFEENTDEKIWQVIEEVELKKALEFYEGGLNCKINDSGSNFSMGQRQLICLARAMLRQNKILILDEATANVDADTDNMIQNTIKSKFNDCTVLTIAHRLNTIIESDRVMVMDAGRLVEFSHPYELLQKSNGHFKKLIDQTGASTADMLTEMAKKNFNKKIQ